MSSVYRDTTVTWVDKREEERKVVEDGRNN